MTANRRKRILRCQKCGGEITFRDWNPDTEPMYYAERRWARAVIRHGWQYHREDFPEGFPHLHRFYEMVLHP